jgi:hypothetical protein
VQRTGKIARLNGLNKLKLAIWIFALANVGVAFAGMCLSLVVENIFSRTLEGGREALPPLSRIYLAHGFSIFAVFAAPLPIAAAVATLRRPATFEIALLFGAGSVLLIALQIVWAVVAVGAPLIIPITKFVG